MAGVCPSVREVPSSIHMFDLKFLQRLFSSHQEALNSLKTERWSRTEGNR